MSAELKAAGSPVKWTEHSLSFATNEQKEPWFLAINPNGFVLVFGCSGNGD